MKEWVSFYTDVIADLPVIQTEWLEMKLMKEHQTRGRIGGLSRNLSTSV